LADKLSVRVLAPAVEKHFKDRDPFHDFSLAPTSREHLISDDLLGAGRALVRLKFPREEEKAIVTHQVVAWLQLD